MNRLFLFLAALVLAASGISANQARSVKVFILAGQSNAVGYNQIKELENFEALREELNDSGLRIMFWPGSNALPGFAGRWTSLQPGVSEIAVIEPYKDGCFGPEISFALNMLKAMHDDTIAIVKFAVGATGIARSTDYDDYIPALAGFDDKGLNWHPPVGGRPGGLLYRDLMENVRNALSSLTKKGLEYEICGFLWMQGEHEAGISKKMAGDYDFLLTKFRESVRHDLELKELPFLVGEINSHTWAFGELAREKQAEACIGDPLSLLVKTIDLQRGGIGGASHFTADGMILLGERFAQAMLRIIRAGTGQSGSGIISFESLLKQLTDRENIAKWPVPDFKLLQASSYDRRSVDPNQEGWFANEDWSNYERKEINQGREEYVLMDVQGPGAITRFWTGGHPNQKNTLRFYIDGGETPFWEADHTGALIGQNKDIGVPLSQRSVDQDSLNINKGAQPGHNLYAPVPFARQIKITSTMPQGDASTGFWYNINYRLYQSQVEVESFSANSPVKYYEELRKANKELDGFMNLPALSATVPVEKELFSSGYSLNPGESKSLRIDNPGAIKRILVSLKARNMDQAVRDTWLRINFDGNQSVDIPLGFFFGCGDQLVEAKDWYRKVDTTGNLACFWVMPYQYQSVVSLVNQGREFISGSIEVAIGDWRWDDRSMYFHAAYNRLDEMPANSTVDFNFISLENQTGVYVGDNLQAFKTFRGWWGEGDEKIYIDGNTFPDHFGTGSEDYYGYAWGHPETFNNIFTCQPIGNANTGNVGGTSVNSRVRSLDAIPFQKSLKVDMESWQKYGGPVNYVIACFWYGK